MHVLQKGKWRGLCAVTAQCQAQHGLRADRFQAYFLARKVRRNSFPHVSTVMWPSPLPRRPPQARPPRGPPRAPLPSCTLVPVGLPPRARAPYPSRACRYHAWAPAALTPAHRPPRGGDAGACGRGTWCGCAPSYGSTGALCGGRACGVDVLPTGRRWMLPCEGRRWMLPWRARPASVGERRMGRYHAGFPPGVGPRRWAGGPVAAGAWPAKRSGAASTAGTGGALGGRDGLLFFAL